MAGKACLGASGAFDWDVSIGTQDAPMGAPSPVQHLCQNTAIKFHSSALHLDSLLPALGGEPKPSQDCSHRPAVGALIVQACT